MPDEYPIQTAENEGMPPKPDQAESLVGCTRGRPAEEDQWVEMEAGAAIVCHPLGLIGTGRPEARIKARAGLPDLPAKLDIDASAKGKDFTSFDGSSS